MSKRAVLLSGNLKSGFRVTGPYEDWKTALEDTFPVEPSRYRAYLLEIIDFEEDTTTDGDFVLLLGDTKNGFKVYGPYATAELAADAASPFCPNPINPYRPCGAKQACVFRMTAPSIEEAVKRTADKGRLIGESSESTSTKR